jgi:PAS domain S-box-containing protein
LPSGESETLLLRQVIEAADEGIWVTLDGRTRFANRRMAQLLGYSMEELVGRSVIDFVDPEEASLVRERRELSRAGHRQRFETELHRADGSTFVAEISSSPMHDRAGRYQGAVAVVRDVTARNESDREARFRAALLDSIGEAVAVATPDGTLVYVNPAAERMFGWRAPEIIGKNGVAVMSSPEAFSEAQRVHSRLQQGIHYSGDLRLARRDGSTFAAHFANAPVLDDRDELIGMIGVIHDLTERIGHDDELRERELQLETVALLGAHALRRGLGPARNPDVVLTECVEAIRRVLVVDQASILKFAPDAAQLVIRTSSPPTDEETVVPAGSRSFAGYAALARSVVVVDDVSADRRFDLTSSQVASGTVSAIAAPVFDAGGVQGIVLAEKSSAHVFDQPAVHFMQSMANIVGVALADPGRIDEHV